MKRALLMLALAVAPLLAQPQPQNAPEERVARVIHLKYANPESVAVLVRPFGLNVQPDSRLMAVTLEGRKSAVDAAETAVKQLDVPPPAAKDVDLTVYFVVGTEQVQSVPGAPPPQPIPQEIQSTVATLKQTFPFKNYSLLDALALRVRAGTGGVTSGQLSTNRLTSFSVGRVNIEEGNMIRIDRLHAGLRVLIGMKDKNQFVNMSSVDTDVVDVKEGQKLVVGRSSLEGPGKALFLVMIAHVAQ